MTVVVGTLKMGQRKLQNKGAPFPAVLLIRSMIADFSLPETHRPTGSSSFMSQSRDPSRGRSRDRRSLETKRRSQEIAYRNRRRLESEERRERHGPLTLSNILYPIYIVPMLLILFALALVLWIPFASCRVARPRRQHEKGFDEKKRPLREAFDPDDENSGYKRDVISRIGRGPEQSQKGAWDCFWTFWTRRTWEMYTLLRDSYQMISRQGLQLLGLASGFIIACIQGEIMYHDFRTKNVFFAVLLVGQKLTEGAGEAIPQCLVPKRQSKWRRESDHRSELRICGWHRDRKLGQWNGEPQFVLRTLADLSANGLVI
jgi:hypothetical protein